MDSRHRRTGGRPDEPSHRELDIDLSWQPDRDGHRQRRIDVIDSHELQANAVEVGRFLFDGLRELATRYSLIGEVRGTGLMLGFELIEPKTKVPAVAATNAVHAQCRERGLLIGKDGLLGNVLRVTPPMTVTLFLRRWFVLFFIDHGTRHVHIPGITRHPTGPWITQQARNYLVDLGDRAESISFLIRDRGTYFTDSFDAVFQANGVHVIPTLPQVPRMNAIAERWTGSCRREATDRVLITGERHLRLVVGEYTEHYNRHRPHQSLGQRAPDRLTDPKPPIAKDHTRITRHDRLGGLIHEYSQVA